MVLSISDSMTSKMAPVEWQGLGEVNLVMIICNHCPYVLFRMNAISQLVKDYKDRVNIIAVNSNDYSPNTDDSNIEDSPEFMPAFVKKYDLQCDYIFDEDQSIARDFGAICTPEFYVIDKKGIIVYHGEFDPSHTSNDLEPTGSSLRHALDLTLVNKPITWDPNPSFGCSIKWKPKPTNLCVYAWKGLQLSPNGNISMCCEQHEHESIGNLEGGKKTIAEIRRSDTWNEIRQSMLDGKQHPTCSKCWDVENAGFYSVRQFINDQYPESLEGIDSAELKDDVLHQIDIRQSNICNMKCLSCNAAFSSMWGVEVAKEQGLPATNGVIEIDNDDIYDYLHSNIEHIKEFYFAGGEPLMNKVHWDILEDLVKKERYDVRLVYNTNLLKLENKSKHIFDYWDKFTNWHAGVSIDAIGKRAEYVRNGTSWDKIDDNISLLSDRYNQPGETRTFSVDLTMSAINVGGAIEVFEYLNRIGLKNYRWTNYVYNPTYLHVSVLPRFYREQLVEEFKSYFFESGTNLSTKNLLGSDGYEFFKNQMLNNEIATEEDKKKFKNFILRKDKIRNTNIFDACPEFEELWDKI